MQNELLFDTELKTALERISIIDSSKLILRLSPKTPDKRLYDKKGFPMICNASKNICTDRVSKETSGYYKTSTCRCSACVNFSDSKFFLDNNFKFKLSQSIVFLAVKDDRWWISDCQYESINRLTWILSSPILSSSARSSRIWMPGNFSVSKESSNRFSCSSVNAVRRRLCRDLSPIRNNSWSGASCLKIGGELSRGRIVWHSFLAIVGYLVLNTHWADFNYSTIASCLRAKAINQSMDVNGKRICANLKWRAEKFQTLYPFSFSNIFLLMKRCLLKLISF